MMTPKVTIYSKVSCIPSNDFIDYWSDKTDLQYYRLRDSQYPQIAHDFEYADIEEMYDRKFYSIPIIFINGTYISSLKEAYNILREENAN